jgi:hypothetical protein
VWKSFLEDQAFKHGVTEADIRHAIATARYDGPMEGFENKYVLVGFDAKANPIEIFYNEFGDKSKNIFHAIPCRNVYLPLFAGEEK